MGCYLSSVEPVVNPQAEKCTKLSSLESKGTWKSSTSNTLSTANSSIVFGTSPNNKLSKSFSKPKAAKTDKYLSNDAEESETKEANSQRYQFQSRRSSLKEQFNLNLNKMFTNYTQNILTPQAFIEDYIFIEKIGDGGEGEVHKIFHKSSSQYRVAKIAKLSKSNSQSFNKGVLQEAQLLGSLDHPNIVKIHEMVQDSNQITLILEHVAGGSLLEHLNNPLFQTDEAIATVMDQLLSAIASLHEKGIIHKDIKLENIVFEEANPFSTLKLIDFGYSERKDKSYTKSSSGTLMYMASEVFTMIYNEKVDVWAIGVVLYLLLFKEVPFTGKTSDDIVEDIFSKDMNSLFKKKQILCTNPFAIPFLKKLLERDPMKRYSAKAALNDPFLQKFAKRPKIKSGDIETLQVFENKTVVEILFSSIFANNLMTVEEKSDLVRLFRALDSDKDGFIESDDLKVFGIDVKNSLTLFDDTNSGRSTKLSLANFTAALTNFQNKKDEVRKLFVFLDKDRDMLIKVKDIYQILEGQIDKQLMDEIKKYFEEKMCSEFSYINFATLLKAF